MKKLVVLSLLVLLMVMPAVQADDIDWMQYGGSEITILMPEHPVLDGMRSVMEDFGSATGITVNVEALAENLYFDRMEVALRADAGVMDVYMVPMDSTAFTQWSNGLIHPLSPYINDSSMTSADYDFADFPGGFTQATQYPPVIWTRRTTPSLFPLRHIPCSTIRTSLTNTSTVRFRIPWAA